MSTQPEFILPPEPRLKGVFRVYRLRAGELVYFGDAPDAASMGVFVTCLYDEGEIGVDDCLGVKRERGVDEDGNELPGEWVVNPFNLGRSRRLLDEAEQPTRCRAWSRSHGRRCRKRATHGEFCDVHARMAMKA